MYDAYRTPAAPPPPPTPPKKPFWTRPKVGAAGLVLGLAVGLAGTGDAESAKDDEVAKSVPPARIVQQGATDQEVRQQVDEAVETATGDLEDRLAAKEEELIAQQEQADAAMSDLKTRAKKAQKAAVEKAVTKALADVPEPVDVVEEPAAPEPDPEPSTDPHFGTCAEAKDAGYGPYYSGQDPEYDWYTDRDSDGIVCE